MQPPFLHPHIDAVENFNPNYTRAPFYWIPKGLMEDLLDATNEVRPIIDNVSGFTIQQLFTALQSDVTSVSQFKNKLIEQFPASQTQLTNLFAQYHY